MAMSRTSLVDRAYLRNQSLGGLAASVPYARYDAMVTQALANMAEEFAGDKDERVRNQLKKDFTVTVTSGSGSLATITTASEPFMDHTIHNATVTSADSSYPWQYLPDYRELTLGRPTFGMIYFTVKNGNLIATDTGGQLGSLSTTATISGNYIPLAATLSGNLDLEEAAIRVLAQMMTGVPNVPATV